MAVRLASLLPRVSVLVAVLLGASATITFAAAGTLVSAPQATQTTASATPSTPETLKVPDVRNQAFVFAKGMLEDAGFAWKVSSAGAEGFATNIVATQYPAPNTKVIDTGAPTIVVTLVRNRRYPQRGAPEQRSPYTATALELAAPEHAATTTTASTTAATTTTAPTTTAEEKAPVQKPAKKTSKYPQKRPPAFVVPGAPKEPLDEMPLPDRARLLGTWLASHPKATDANVRHWLYQHAWIVTGAKFGWWRGADALKILIADDRRAEQVWGIGGRSQRIARAALAEVEARAK